MTPALTPACRRARLAALVLTAAAAGSAAAQATVAIFGTIDASIGRFNGAPTGVSASDKTLTRQEAGGLSTSFIGFRGSEDLGDGMAASFELSGFFRNDTGAMGRSDAIGPPVNVAADPFFSRSSWVGLTRPGWGRLRLGSFGSPMWIGSLTSNAFVDSTVFSPLNLVTFIGGPLTGSTGWTNQIAWDSPTVAGFSLALASSGSEGQGGRNAGARLGYANGPWTTSLGWQDVKKNPVTFADGTSPNNTQSWQLAVGLDGGWVQVWAHAGKIRNRGTEAAPLAIDYRIRDLSARFPIGQGSILAGIADRRTSDAVGPVPATAAGGNRARQVVTVGYDYYLSKRTDLYLMVMQDRTETHVLPVPPRVVTASGSSVAVGARHRF